METYDVIVIGLGPGGSTAARELALKGHSVLGLEKVKMPRVKPCGGCLSAKIQTVLDETLEALAEETITRVILTFHGEGDIRVESQEPIAYMVSREKFDYHLYKKAESAGAEVHDGEPVTDIEQDDEGYVVNTQNARYRCRFLIGADGVNGVTSRLLGYASRRNIAVALEGEVKVEERSLKQLNGTVRLDVGAIPYGYGWIFPKQDHWSLGVGSVKELNKHPKDFYSGFLEEQGVDEIRQEEKLRGYRIPLFASSKSRLTKGRSLLVGDAAALVDPFLGEGIYYAIRSGRIAAETIDAAIETDAPEFPEYQQRVGQEFFPEFEPAHKIAQLSHRFPRLAFALFKFKPAVGEALMQVLQGSLSYSDYWRQMKKDVKFGVFEFLNPLKTPQNEVEATYDRIARQYDAGDFLWKQVFAKSAWSHFESLVKEVIPKHAVILDAGAGTGESTRTVLRLAKPRRIVGIDVSSGMLNVAREKLLDPRVELRKADMRRLPFADSSFDAVVSTWAIETLSDPKAAVREFLRVIKEDGYVLYVFSSMPKFGAARLYSFMLEKFLGKTFDWRFLPGKERPYHDCQHSSLTSFGNGLMTVVVLRKCCSVEDEAAPCLLSETWDMEKVTGGVK
ncbi:geranylgeranyl reductase family protein [candidate division KSB1 bacterium]|nr:geranylgeranyl reductase family protein [candidate division KSB1 bacterium]NIR69054.1 geranylgeranyl reductase family protein [candidate division KSB1 bacterium]NIS25622.1 geranylgeranyl reductase family protein [candidate division KSB1 bacterium]NIT73972.1 geranylgeranyl reductase family protein [candidate division KSB1 bacterium]NIU26299.1 geranylgeranyl reductase family protein [candidate division KSB1 bacterium]